MKDCRGKPFPSRQGPAPAGLHCLEGLHLSEGALGADGLSDRCKRFPLNKIRQTAPLGAPPPESVIGWKKILFSLTTPQDYRPLAL